MGIKTDISWCDSSLNAQAGCQGCELWTSKTRICYAGILTERYGGRPGWPDSFDKPKIFPERIAKSCAWPDMRGVIRPDKPWIKPSTPRLIFLDDMGDTFTEGLPIDWLMPHIPAMENGPHIWQFLTKRPKRMAQFFDMLGYVPKNFWLGTSVTDQRTADARIPHLIGIKNCTRFISAEPLFGQVSLSQWLTRWPVDTENGRIYKPFHWLIAGGMSGNNRIEMDLVWAQSLHDQCKASSVAFFMKQDSGLRSGMRGRLSDDLWNCKEFPDA